MKRHIAYLKYVLKHKWFVFIACWKCGAPFWRAVIHDWHKLLPSEWFAYAQTFYKPDGGNQYVESPDFERAWNLHQKRGKHHWQHWLLTFDRGDTTPLEMSEPYAREMVADWWGAGRAITGEWAAHQWYPKNSTKMILHPETRRFVEGLLEETRDRFETPELISKRIRIMGC